MIGTLKKPVVTRSDSIETLRIRLRHLENDFALTRIEYEDAIGKYLATLSEMKRKNHELEELRETLEARVLERTAELSEAKNALEQEVLKQQKTEQALIKAEAQNQLLVEHLPVCFITLEPDGTLRVIGNNYSRRVLGCEPGAADRLPHFVDVNNNPMETGTIMGEALRRGVYETECLLHYHSGAVMPVRMVLVPYRDASGRVGAYYGFLEDISGRRRAEAAARQHAEEIAQTGKLVAVGTLVAGVAHEMNNPNNLIMLSVPVLKKWFQQLLNALEDAGACDSEDIINMRENAPRLLASIEEGACRMRDIVRKLRDFAKPDERDFDQPLVVNELADAAVKMMRDAMPEAADLIEIEYGQCLPVLRGHPGQVRQIIFNLLKNACESLPPSNGWVRLATRFGAQHSGVVVEVEDNGSGITPENIPRLCDPFFTTRREQGITGLGLAVTAAMVRVHRGTLAFESELGQGTKATVHLPAKMPADLNAGGNGRQ